MANIPLADCLPINWVRVNVYRSAQVIPNSPSVWLVALQEEDGTECFMDEKPNYISAMSEALSYGLPVYYYRARPYH